MLRRPLVCVAWPAFLAACALELLVFAVMDPHDVQWPGRALAVSPQGVYTIAFFAFWAVSMAASGLAMLLAGPAPEVASGRFDAGETVQEGAQ